MNTQLIYKIIFKVYDLLDVIYFRNEEKSPRKAVLERIKNDDKILDLCTGTATNALSIAKSRPNTEVVGMDLSNKMLSIAKEKLRKSGLENIKLYKMDATALKFNSGYFDKIVISLVLHEMEEDLAAKVITEAMRVLKDEGEIIITEWEPSDQLKKKILFAPIHYLEPKPYKNLIKKDLYLYFEQFGLKIIKYEHCDYTKVVVLKKI